MGEQLMKKKIDGVDEDVPKKNQKSSLKIKIICANVFQLKLKYQKAIISSLNIKFNLTQIISHSIPFFSLSPKIGHSTLDLMTNLLLV